MNREPIPSKKPNNSHSFCSCLLIFIFIFISLHFYCLALRFVLLCCCCCCCRHMHIWRLKWLLYAYEHIFASKTPNCIVKSDGSLWLSSVRYCLIVLYLLYNKRYQPHNCTQPPILIGAHFVIYQRHTYVSELVFFSQFTWSCGWWRPKIYISKVPLMLTTTSSSSSLIEIGNRNLGKLYTMEKATPI